MNAINPVLGNKSIEQLPNNCEDETKIQTHLRYIEEKLRKEVDDQLQLTEELARNRTRNLNLLREYWTRGVFPNNFEYLGRRPCFIDQQGNICAVGYLVEQTAGLDAAKRINAVHQYDTIKEMTLPLLSEWQSECGLSLQELAMIQPTYQFREQQVPGRVGWTVEKEEPEYSKAVVLATVLSLLLLAVLFYRWKQPKLQTDKKR